MCVCMYTGELKIGNHAIHFRQPIMRDGPVPKVDT